MSPPGRGSLGSLHAAVPCAENGSVRKRAPRKQPVQLAEDDRLILNPYVEVWLSLTPAQRLVRAWRLRRLLPNLQAVHDAKTYPRL